MKDLPALARSISTLGPLGRCRLAPGTVGAAAAALLGLCLAVSCGTVAVAALAAFTALVGQWACETRGDGDEDPREVVIDEAAGQLVAVIGVRPGPAFVLAFGLFRLFDIWKPWPIGRIEERGGRWAVMGDDVAAGCMARLLLIPVDLWM
ncbi:phosphatidylglycerophosphatase A [Candidatus Fermentibacteria bacterium]|nr:phosphatidylglycerophosphatase A [Candidatus Fermentibacteria bacterium]